MSDFQQTITSLNLLHTSLYRMELFMNAQAVNNARTDVISLISQLEKAERERDELRKTLEATQDGTTEAINHSMQLKEEIERRDAAASEPVGEVRLGEYGSDGIRPVRVVCLHEQADWENFPDGTKLYTAAQPAVLPPEMKAEPEKYDVIDHGFIAGYNQCRSDALALGAQPQKVVELPALLTVSEVMQRSGFDWHYAEGWASGQASTVNDFIHLLDAANVKWQVKK